jgi:hypothetical protein
MIMGLKEFLVDVPIWLSMEFKIRTWHSNNHSSDLQENFRLKATKYYEGVEEKASHSVVCIYIKL